MMGVINVLKPPFMTSHDVVAITRRTLNMKKVGHTGTLDPMACGVLPICVGKATKIVDYIQDDKKTYRCKMKLGSSTNTQDRWGEIVEESNKVVSNEEIKAVIATYHGEIEQIPPMFSALKVGGKKLVDLAREGQVIERKPRIRTIFSISNIEIDFPQVTFDVVCSKGTYIRTLCNDIGEDLGTFGHMTFLERLATGKFNLTDAITVEELRATEDFSTILRPVDQAIDTVRIDVPVRLENAILNGRIINLKPFLRQPSDENTIYAVYVKDVFIGIALGNSEEIYMKKRF